MMKTIKTNPQQIAYVLLRITMGFNMMIHGLVRIPKINAFKNGMIELFKPSLLPGGLVSFWSTILPFLEFLIGVLLILGLFTRKVVLAGAVLIIILIIGSCLLEKWEWVGIQMIYVLFYYLLIKKVEDNHFSVDSYISKSKL